ncbi:MAG: type II CRISPR RNA-guided endonuclease Cas9 [Bacteroidales bacterium]|nr:type II CRISPR RNA-guided endonuclease Cas9 [Bacteroidales bacterium]
MKKILGLDLGTNSIGWALIKEENNENSILGLGSRIIPLNPDERDEFSAGNEISKNRKRTMRRTQRKGYDRYQLRRKALTELLIEKDLFPGRGLLALDQLPLWGLRAKAVTEKVELKELGRVLYHLNQKRGYKSSRREENLDKKDTEYVAEVKSRHLELKEMGATIGQKFYPELEANPNYRIKQQVYPREAYIEEFDAILKQQQKHYPDIITDEFINTLRNEIIYYQRKLKSQKGLVSVCDFEGFWTNDKEGREVFVGPKVAPRSSPLFQISKIWESINTLKLKNKKGEEYSFSMEEKKKIFEHLDNNEKLTAKDLFGILGIDKNDGWYYDKQLLKGIQGNLTKTQFAKILEINNPWLNFDLQVEKKAGEAYLVSKSTGEISDATEKKEISPELEYEPLYKLWHVIYSISDFEECKKVLQEKFLFDELTAEKLARIDFTKSGFGNKSAKAIRKILPYLMDGWVYSDACSFAGYNHSGSLTKDENLKRKLLDSIPLLPKNSLRQPVVEKILNQMINLVNAVTETYGRPDEIRVELARELKQSQEERNDTFKFLRKRERENDQIRNRLIDEYGIRATRNNVIKFRLFHEINGEESKLNAGCVYCGKPFGISDALRGDNVDVEHIIPKSLLFDDSQSNKTLSHRACNEAKGNKTAFDFMQQKGSTNLEAYIERVDKLFNNGLIGKAKRDKLLMPASKIPDDFIERQIRETQYISRKAREILQQVCFNVWSTSGSVTDYLRRLWGWDDILMNLQLPRHKEQELTEWVEWETGNGQLHKKEVIKGWTKRNDHRHHAIDALVVACTKQGFIQRINNLSSQGNRDEMYRELKENGENQRNGLSLLEKYLIAKKPFNTNVVQQKTAEILISFKAGKKVATYGKRKIKKGGKTQVVQTGIVVPRGPLSEESVYGRIMTLQRDPKTNKVIYQPLKYLFANPQLIFKPRIKELIEERLAQFDGNVKNALDSVKKEPIYLDRENEVLLENASCYSEEFVIKYPVEGLKPNDVPYIIDGRIRQLVKERLDDHGGNPKEAFKEPLWYDKEKSIKINSIRLLTGLSSVEPVKWDDKGQPIGFVKPGNNHHIAIYRDITGQLIEHVCTFWHAVERKKFGLPVIIKNPEVVWSKILSKEEPLPESFLGKLPTDGLKFEVSLQQNEMFIIGMQPEEINSALLNNEKEKVSKNLFRVQKLGSFYYVFRHHLETQIDDSAKAMEAKKFYRIRSFKAWENANPFKVFLNYLGEIKPSY